MDEKITLKGEITDGRFTQTFDESNIKCIELEFEGNKMLKAGSPSVGDDIVKQHGQLKILSEELEANNKILDAKLRQIANEIEQFKITTKNIPKLIQENEQYKRDLALYKHLNNQLQKEKKELEEQLHG